MQDVVSGSACGDVVDVRTQKAAATASPTQWLTGGV